MKRIEIGKRARKHKGYFALVDDSDYLDLVRHNWTAQHIPLTGGFYAYRWVATQDGRSRIYMHRQVMGVGSDKQVDHRNHQTLDNRRGNLRVATRTQNAQNRKARRGFASRYKGITRREMDSKSRPWVTLIVHPTTKKQIRLGCFSTEEEAARAYDRAAVEHYGEFAHLNFPQPAGAA